MIIKVTIFVLNLFILNVLCFESTPHNKSKCLLVNRQVNIFFYSVLNTKPY
jgi:hypothetical protein